MLFKFLIGTFCVIMIIGLHLHGKLAPHKDKLDPQYLKWYEIFEKIYGPILNFLKGMISPVKVGKGLSLDFSSVVFLIVFLFILLVL